MKSITYTCDNCKKQIPCGNRYFTVKIQEMYNLHEEQTVSSKRMYHLCCDCFYTFTKREALGIEPES